MNLERLGEIQAPILTRLEHCQRVAVLKPAALFIAVVCTGSIALGPDAQAENWERTFDLLGAPELRVITDHAHVRLETWNRPSLRVRLVARGWTIGREGLRVSAEQDSDRVRVEVLLPRWGFSPDWTRRSIDLVIRMPDSARIDVETEDGDITLPPMKGEFRARSWDGLITASGLAGPITLRIGNGSIRARQLQGSIFAQADDGALELEGRFNRLAASSRDGDIFVRVAPGSVLSEEWSIETQTGQIVVELPADLAADLEAQSDRGRVEWGKKRSRASPDQGAMLRQRLGTAIHKLRLSSERGDILIEQRKP